MIDILDGKLYDVTPQRIHEFELEPGDKLEPNVNSEIASIMLSNELEKIGYKTRVGKNIESGKWSVAILSK